MKPNGDFNWNIDLVDDEHDQGRVGLWSSIKVDDYGNLHVAYMSEKYDSLKYLFRKRLGGYTKVYIDGEPPASLKGSMCSIALLGNTISGDAKTRERR